MYFKGDFNAYFTLLQSSLPSLSQTHCLVPNEAPPSEIRNVLGLVSWASVL